MYTLVSTAEDKKNFKIGSVPYEMYISLFYIIMFYGIK
jgi:hypothetical protein